MIINIKNVIYNVTVIIVLLWAAIIPQLLLTIVMVLFGAMFAYIGLLGMKDKYKPGGPAGARLNYSKNYKLFNQDRYWYPINRYAGKWVLYLGILWALLSIVIFILPGDLQLKMYIHLVMLFLLVVAFIVIAVLTHRFANRLIAQ